jgi:hypothetical protein
MIGRLSTRAQIGILVGLMLMALAVRLPLTDAALFDFAPMRQFYSALTARAFYFDLAPDGVSDARRAVVDDYMRTATRLEPPVIEAIAALAYALAGREDLRLPIALSWVYWLAGGIALYALVCRLTPSRWAAYAAVIVYWFLPYTITATRTFQPDAPALLCLLAALYALVRCDEQPSRARWIILAAACGAAALFIRLMTGFFLFPAFGLLMARRYGVIGALRRPSAWAFAAVVIAPTALYYASTILAAAAGRERVDTNFVPALFGQASFWEAWARLLTMAFPVGVLLIAAAGVVLWRGRGRALVAGLWIGYAIYGALFNFHISTHPYYQTIFVPGVALGIAGLVAWLDERIAARRDAPARAPTSMTSRTTLAASLAFAFAALLAFALPYDAVFPSHVRADPRALEAYRAAGLAAQHSARVIAMTDNWATPLRYYGEVAGQYFPTRYEIEMYRPMGARGIPDIAPEQRIADLAARMGGADYFIVTDMRELDVQPDVRAHLDATYPVIARGETYIVYDLQPD